MNDASQQLFTVYEEHLRQSSVVVAEEQNQLSRNLRETDQTVAQILGNLFHIPPSSSSTLCPSVMLILFTQKTIAIKLHGEIKNWCFALVVIYLLCLISHSCRPEETRCVWGVE